MLVLTRKESQRIQIGDNITITVVRVQGNKVRIGIEAPAELPICREEILFDASPLNSEIDSTDNSLSATQLGSIAEIPNFPTVIHC